jgi:hypothetical protein
MIVGGFRSGRGTYRELLGRASEVPDSEPNPVLGLNAALGVVASVANPDAVVTAVREDFVTASAAGSREGQR